MYFAIGNLLEFISNHNMLNPAECEELGMDFIKTRTENDQYYLDKIICLEEKRCIIDMVFQIEKQVKE